MLMNYLRTECHMLSYSDSRIIKDKQKVKDKRKSYFYYLFKKYYLFCLGLLAFIISGP
jgi:hypothetical protein